MLKLPEQLAYIRWPACSAFWRLFLGVLLLAAAARAWETEWFDARGRLVRVPLEQGWIDCKSEIAVAAADWAQVAYLSTDPQPQSVVGSSGAVWRAEISPESGMTCQVMQVAHVFTNGVRLSVTATADGTNSCAGIFFILHLPAARFAGGWVDSEGRRLSLPARRAVPYVLGIATNGSLEVRNPIDTGSIRLATAPALSMQVQDNRRWSDEFAIVSPIWNGPLPPGRPITASVVVTGAGRTLTQPAEVAVDLNRPLHRFDGFGGNYCYGLSGLMARTVFGTVAPSWARVQMRLDELKPPGNPSRAIEDFERQLIRADKPGTELRECLDMQALLATNRTPYFISLWRAPSWMYTNREPRQEGNVLKPAEWKTLAAAVTAYLRVSRNRTGFEPEAFSINEPDCGASIAVTPEDYPGVLRTLGDALERSGSRTRLLLGDVGNPREPARAYLIPALGDPGAMRHVSWLSFHAWGDATSDEMSAWSDLADRLRLPQVVAEVGVDPDWRHAPVQRHDYAMMEMARYFNLLRFARPQAMLLWEHSNDYPVLIRDAAGRFITTARWGIQKQWCRYTPRGSLAVSCQVQAGDRVDACAFVHGAGGGGFTLHLGNRADTRSCRVQGLPRVAGPWTMIRTTRDSHARAISVAQPDDGDWVIDLPAESLTTLTTLPLSGNARQGG